jgi:cysteinyl-tRNA synthetase
MLKIYNTLAKRKEDFMPIKPGEVKMYACGITVYDECHLGHAMQAVFFDLIRRYLEYSGYKVTYVRNYTDIDDKIITRANESGRSPLELSEFYIKDAQQDMHALKVRPATVEPKVSDHIPDIIAFIQRLIEKKAAYQSGSEVFFRVVSFPGYGKLSNRKVDELQPEPGEDTGKESPYDFSLWKPAKPGEPFWESPWGKGRPGWHIECSVMSNKYLGPNFDIHGGGLDIIFPHHENEVAQSEAANGCRFANYWIHNGLLMVENKKMSKSLHNFVTIKNALERYQPDVLRYMIMSFAISSNVNFTEANLSAANKNVLNYYRILERVDAAVAAVPGTTEKSCGIPAIDNIEAVFRDSMDDFFNAAVFLAHLPEAFKALSDLLAAKGTSAEDKAAICRKFRGIFAKITNVIGILDEEPRKYIEAFTNQHITHNKIDVAAIEAKIQERLAARRNKDFKTADAIREQLIKSGIALQDTPSGTGWTIAL